MIVCGFESRLCHFGGLRLEAAGLRSKGMKRFICFRPSPLRSRDSSLLGVVLLVAACKAVVRKQARWMTEGSIPSRPNWEGISAIQLPPCARLPPGKRARLLVRFLHDSLWPVRLSVPGHQPLKLEGRVRFPHGSVRHRRTEQESSGAGERRASRQAWCANRPALLRVTCSTLYCSRKREMAKW